MFEDHLVLIFFSEVQCKFKCQISENHEEVLLKEPVGYLRNAHMYLDWERESNFRNKL